LTEISDFPCLVLLGEPGIGKTTTLKQEYENLKNRVKDSENTFLWKSLGDYDSDSNLCTAIFDNPIFQDWLQGNHRLYLFLDSLDEGRLSIINIVRILKREIEDLPCDRLYFRITCRTYDWAYSLEDKLKEKWGEDNVKIYNLAPLRRIDVIEAAKERGIDAEKFLQEVFNRNAAPLAIKPVTLKFLLGILQRKGEFPNSQKELYEQGCLQLCEEVNRDRCEEKITGNLSTKQRLLVAGRIAALTLFANRSSIWTSPEYGEMPTSDLAIRDLCGGRENIDGQEILIDQACIEEVLSITGLFPSHGAHRMGWAHQTYAEFLAAWYLKERQLNLPQILKLIVHSGDPDNRIVPQLHETVAWLAGMIPEVFREVMKTDPDILLQSDIATADEADKEALVECLLKLHHEEKITYSWYSITSLYKNLNYSNLANQL
jgi:predicted NACHT family NTPase